MATATANRREERAERFSLNNEEAESLLVKYVQELVRHKQETQSWGTSTIEVAWKDGHAESARIREETTHKFGQSGSKRD